MARILWGPLEATYGKRKKRKHTLTPEMRVGVWRKSDGRCWYCGIELFEEHWSVDHVIPLNGQHHPGDPNPREWGNLVPCCHPCNQWKRDLRLDGFRKEFTQRMVGQLYASSNYRQALDFGLLPHVEGQVRFWFEQQEIGQ